MHKGFLVGKPERKRTVGKRTWEDNIKIDLGRAVAQAVSRPGFPPRRLGFKPRSGHKGFVVDKAALGQVSSEYFGFPCHSFQRLLHTHYHQLSSGDGTIGQIVAKVPSGLSLTPTQENKKRMRWTLVRSGLIWLRVGTSGGLL
jgi:hypothetical protein